MQTYLIVQPYAPPFTLYSTPCTSFLSLFHKWPPLNAQYLKIGRGSLLRKIIIEQCCRKKFSLIKMSFSCESEQFQNKFTNDSWISQCNITNKYRVPQLKNPNYPICKLQLMMFLWIPWKLFSLCLLYLQFAVVLYKSEENRKEVMEDVRIRVGWVVDEVMQRSRS